MYIMHFSIVWFARNAWRYACDIRRAIRRVQAFSVVIDGFAFPTVGIQSNRRVRRGDERRGLQCALSSVDRPRRVCVSEGVEPLLDDSVVAMLCSLSLMIILTRLQDGIMESFCRIVVVLCETELRRRDDLAGELGVA